MSKPALYKLLTFPIHFPYLRSFIQTICLSTRPFVTLRKQLIFYGAELLTPRPTPKLEELPLSAVSNCLFNIFSATLHTWRPSPPISSWGRAMPWWYGTHLSWHTITHHHKTLKHIPQRTLLQNIHCCDRAAVLTFTFLPTLHYKEFRDLPWPFQMNARIKIWEYTIKIFPHIRHKISIFSYHLTVNNLVIWRSIVKWSVLTVLSTIICFRLKLSTLHTHTDIMPLCQLHLCKRS
jgi:hypothetical protein